VLAEAAFYAMEVSEAPVAHGGRGGALGGVRQYALVQYHDGQLCAGAYPCEEGVILPPPAEDEQLDSVLRRMLESGWQMESVACKHYKSGYSAVCDMVWMLSRLIEPKSE
jgi:hypothetical protein